jgi:hypothetical protein
VSESETRSDCIFLNLDECQGPQLVFGAGITPGTQKAQTATAIWGAALHAMQLLTYHLREEGETFTPAVAVLVAQRRLIQATTTDYLVGGEPDRMAAWWWDNSAPHARSNESSLGPKMVRAAEEGATYSGWPRSRRGCDRWSIEREVVNKMGNNIRT